MMMTGIKITSSNSKILKIFFISKNKIKRNKNINNKKKEIVSPDKKIRVPYKNINININRLFFFGYKK